MDVNTSWETLDVAGNPMQAYVAVPNKEGQYPGVLVFMEIFGINEHIQDVTRRIANEGYVVIAPDYYHRVAPGLQMGYTTAEIEEGKKHKDQVTQADMIADAQAAIDFLKQHPQVNPKDRFGSIGFCFGGYVAYVAATLPEIAATASFYGAGIAHDLPNKEEPPVDKSGEIKGYMMCLFGDKDESIPDEDIEMIRETLDYAHVPNKVLVYPGADHGFFCDQRGSYNPEVAVEAWGEVVTLFQDQLKGAHVR